jgi:hypothetical protein
VFDPLEFNVAITVQCSHQARKLGEKMMRHADFCGKAQPQRGKQTTVQHARETTTNPAKKRFSKHKTSSPISQAAPLLMAA